MQELSRLLDVTAPLTITGPGADQVTILGNTGWSDRILHVLTTTVTLTGVTLRGGGGTASGGGLYNQAGTVTLSYSAIVSNTTSNGGAGIYSTGTLTLTHSSVLSNTANYDAGGGLWLKGGTATLTNVTISGNRAEQNGGGLVTSSSPTVALTNVTLTGNTADYGGGGTAGDGGGVRVGSGTVTVKNTVIAGNTDASTSGNDYDDCSGTLSSQGYNHVQSTAGCTLSGTTTGNQTGTSAQLNVLGNNGGPTLTHAAQAGSPVINTGTNTGCPAQDQRGYNRDASCDKGAFEYGASAPAQPGGSTVTTTYYYAGAELVAMREITSTGNSLYFVHTDHLGSISAVTSVTGTVVARQYYLPFGGTRPGGTGSMPTDKAFTGQRRDDSTGLMFYQARYYSSSVGRFISADTIVPGAGNPQNLNRYAYGLSNPLKYIDPTGHKSTPTNCYGKPDCGVDLDANWRPAGRPQISQNNLKLIQLIVFAESSNGVHSDEAQTLMAWNWLNRDLNDVFVGAEASSGAWEGIIQGFAEPGDTRRQALEKAYNCQGSRHREHT